jgi:hypothetical protein
MHARQLVAEQAVVVVTADRVRVEVLFPIVAFAAEVLRGGCVGIGPLGADGEPAQGPRDMRAQDGVLRVRVESNTTDDAS